MSAPVTVAVLGKGGTGKTTAAATIGAQLADAGLTVALVDLDSTATLTSWLAPRHAGADVADVLTHRAGLDEATVPVGDRLTLIAGSNGLAQLEGDVDDDRVAELTGKLRGEVDVTLLDLRGGTANRLASLAVKHATAAILTMQPSPMGTTPLTEARVLCEHHGTPLVGVLPSRGSRSTVKDWMLKATLEQGFPLWPPVRQDVAAEEAVGACRLITDYAPRSRVVADYAEHTARLAAALGLTLDGSTPA